jgi:xanthine dehydrogenase molybdenum-binding subunit
MGTSIPRIDGYERVSGVAKYAGDWKMPGMLYARIVQSSIPHGMVREIDASAATKTPGVEGVITCLDDHTVWTLGDRDHDRLVLTDHVRYVGDCIAAVAARSRFIAQKASESVQVRYEEFPAVFNINDSMKPNAPKLWENGNIIGPLKYGFGNITESFRNGDMVIERKYKTSRVHNAPLEPAVSLAWWDESQTKLTVVAATQSIHGCRAGLAADLKMPPENIRVISLYKGGGFGNKNSSMNYDLISVLLSKKTRKPVMLEYSREQDFNSVHGRWSSEQTLVASVRKKDMKILGIELKNYSDIGSYTRRVYENLFVNGSENYYGCESWSADAYGVYTNSPPTGNMRAPTGPQGCFATETLVDEIANELNIDPLEFRIRNTVEKYRGSEEFLTNSLRECLKIGADRFGWKRKWRKREFLTSKGVLDERVRGVGCAMTSWHAYVGRGEAMLKLTRAGILELHVGVVDIGTGAKTTMAIIAANAVGVALDKIQVVWGDTETTPYSIGESGSKTTSFTGTAVKKAGMKIRERVLKIASGYLHLSEEALEIENGIIRSKEGRNGQKKISITIEELFRSASLDEITEAQVTEPVLPGGKARYSFAAHFAEVEVDVETGEVRVLGYQATHESGEIVNRLTSESQVQGSVVMGLGMALSEQVLIDQNYGAMQNATFMTYRPPANSMVPLIDVTFIESSDPLGPKSLGEVAVIPVPAVIGNAIFNATGVRIREIPFTPERVQMAIQQSIQLIA